MLRQLSILTVLLLLSGCFGLGGNDNSLSPVPDPSPTTSPSVEPSSSPAPSPSAPHAATAEEAAKAIMTALQQQDLTTLTSYIHPEKGLLFSPYAHIETDIAITFHSGELPTLEDPKAYEWGSFDGSGEPISLSFSDYYKKFIYDQNFAEADAIGHNEVLGQGNTLVNIQDVFQGSTFFDYHFNGFDPEYRGMDWESLILVLEQQDGTWYISAIVHSQWTI
ncbi:hypothetical protein [Paenibacillus sp. YAF4_2]|uniref:hypothetical protein n=1 Tax=Paenibacillus sp. YAF4_2 TaxID=3233085 RepID=UPI003F97C451